MHFGNAIKAWRGCSNCVDEFIGLVFGTRNSEAQAMFWVLFFRSHFLHLSRGSWEVREPLQLKNLEFSAQDLVALVEEGEVPESEDADEDYQEEDLREGEDDGIKAFEELENLEEQRTNGNLLFFSPSLCPSEP